MSTTAVISHTDSRSVRIRAGVLSDADAIFALLGQLGQSAIPQRQAFSSALTHSLERPDEHLLLVAIDPTDRVVAYALVTIARLFYTNGTAAQLQELVVDDGHRGRRIGTALVSTIEEQCRKRGVVQLTVASLRGAAFYEGLGYRSTADYLKKALDS